MGITSLVCESPMPEPIDGVCKTLCESNVQKLASCRSGVKFDTQPGIIWNILCTALAMAGGSALGSVHRCFEEVCTSVPFVRGVNSSIGGNLELLAFCLSTRSERFLRPNSNAICRFSRVEWVNSSVVVDLQRWGIPRIIATGNFACRSNIKKNGVSCIVVLKDVL